MKGKRKGDLHLLPRFQDRLSYVYIEHAKIDRYENAIAYWDKDGMTAVPIASVAVLMLGPGTTLTQPAIGILADNNCLVMWCGEEGVRFYACGMGGTRSATRMLHQARLVSDERERLTVVRRMYKMRFKEEISPTTTIEQLRGMEGARVRQAYSKQSAETGIEWSGRSYNPNSWAEADSVNRALSSANACLYGLCQAAILSAGYSPALGFIHTGNQLSFVFDVADLYKVDLTIPLAFGVAKDPPPDMPLERAVRLACRDIFRKEKLLTKILPDIRTALGEQEGEEDDVFFAVGADAPVHLWTPESEAL